MRVAIQSALDRQALVQTGGYGQPVPAAGLLTSATRCYSTSFANIFPHDLARAKQTLDDIGWVPGPDGIRQKDGTSLTFDLVYFPDYADLATTIQAQLREAGVQLSLKMLDLSAGNALMRSGQASAFLVANVSNDPSTLTAAFHSRAIGSASFSGAIVQDPDSDALLDSAARESDPIRQCQLYDEFQQRYLQAATAYPVWELTSPMAMRSNIQGVRLVPTTGSMPLFQETYLQPE